MLPLLTAACLALPADFASRITGLASLDDMRAGADLVAFVVPEAEQGADLNGDGDQADDVLHVHFVESGVTRNVGLAVSAVSTIDIVLVNGDLIAFEVSEMAQGQTDLDGDGSLFDHVLFLHDAGTDTTTNLGFPGQFFRSSLDDPEWIPFAVGEALTNTDFNGDGDVNDQVLFVHSITSGTVEGTGIAIEFVISPSIDAGRMAFAASESAMGADLTGDGDLLDTSLFTRDLASGTNTNWQIPARDLQLVGDRLAFLVHEPLVGMDLAGDGQRFDYVPHVLDFPSATITNTGLAFRRFEGIHFDGRYLLTAVNEHRESTDFNGDGDIFLFDDVLHVTDTQSFTTQNLGQSAHIVFGTRRDGRDGRYVAMAVSEQYEGNLDRNGDGDATDTVLATFDFQTRTVRNTQLEVTAGFQLVGSIVASATAEGAKDDFNGNGSMLDRVLFLHDARTDTNTNARIAVRDIQLGATVASFRRVPLLPAVGLDGSATPGDEVGWIDLIDGSYHRTNVTANQRGYIAGTSFVAYATPERLFGRGTDLNGDGDTGDRVLIVERRLP